MSVGIFTRLFGHEGTVRIEGRTVDGQVFSGKIKIAHIGYSRSDIEQKLKEILFQQTGKRAKTLHIVGET